MSTRDTLIDELLETISELIDVIEKREIVDSDFTVVREVAEQLYEELDSLRD